MSHKEKTSPQSDILILEKNVAEHHIVLFDDDVNTFDFVIDSLVDVCKHDRTQAEQCTYLVHYKGRCSVKDGSFNKLRPMCEALLDRGLTAAIE